MASPGRPQQRISTGILGFDTILNGGLLKGGLYLIVGGPGTGKTVLVNQLGSHRAAQGEHVVFVSMLTESHGQMLQNLGNLSFFEPSLVARQVHYFSGLSALENQGAEGLRKQIQRVIRKHKARLLILDSLSSLSDSMPSQFEFKKFLRELGSFCSLAECTTLLVSYHGPEQSQPEGAMADGVFRLDRQVLGLRDVRHLEVIKFRGSSHLEGRHMFSIGGAGLSVHPRTESLLATSGGMYEENPTRRAFGIPALDEMMRGGVTAGSTTAILGAPGSGKTLLGLHFLAEGIRQGQRGIYFGFYEPPSRLLTKAEGIGLPLSRHVESGQLEILWQPAIESLIDQLAERLLASVYRQQVCRLFIDGIDGFLQGSFFRERIPVFFTALSNRLRELNVTTLVSEETKFFGQDIERPDIALLASIENILHLHFEERRSQLHRLLSILKMRESDFDPTVREFHITSSGLLMAGTGKRAKAAQRGRGKGGSPGATSRKRVPRGRGSRP